MSVLVDKITLRRTQRNALAQHTPDAQGTVDDSQPPPNKEGEELTCCSECMNKNQGQLIKSKEKQSNLIVSPL